jgi:hypothetical protein
MTGIRLIYLIFLLLHINLVLHAQAGFSSDRPLNLQAGYALKLMLELGKSTVFHAAISGGVASNFLTPEIYPSLHSELQVYTGGLGTRKPLHHEPWFTVDFMMAMTVTAGITSNQLRATNEVELRQRNIPLYYFSNLSAPPLINPFNSSVSLGSNLIWSTGDRERQRVGFINIHPVERFQISYLNDGGPPIDMLKTGDQEDRYYTGGVVFSYHGPRFTLANRVELGYHKFTGYTKNSYQVAKRLNHAYVNYMDTTQIYLNRSVWSLTVAHAQQVGITARVYNKPGIDLQHFIHWKGYSPYHLVPHRPGVSFSGQFYYQITKIGLR